MPENGEETYFAFSAGLRIHGGSLDLDEITREMGLRPTYVHRAGQTASEVRGKRPRPNERPFPDDAWHYNANLPEEAPLDMHLQMLWADVAPRREYLRSLKSKHAVDVFCGYRSNHHYAGFQIEPKSLAIFVELEIPFGISVIIA